MNGCRGLVLAVLSSLVSEGLGKFRELIRFAFEGLDLLAAVCHFAPEILDPS